MSDLSEKVDNLQHELEELQARLKKSEQSREHWKLECQLVQMKHDKVKEAVSQESSATAEGDAKQCGDQANEQESLLKSRIDDLVAEKLLADSKVSHFYNLNSNDQR